MVSFPPVSPPIPYTPPSPHPYTPHAQPISLDEHITQEINDYCNIINTGTINVLKKLVLLWAPPNLLFFFLELLLQYTEHTSMLKILNYHKIVGCFRYIDDILIIYDNRITEIKIILKMRKGRNMLHRRKAQLK